MLEVFAFFVCIFVWFLVKFRKLGALYSHISGPPIIPFLGNGLLFIGKTPEEIFQLTFDLPVKYGNIFKVFLASKVVIVLTAPQEVEALLSSLTLIEKADEYEPIKEWLGDGLLISTGDKWHARRKVFTPAFHFKILEQFVEIFDKQSKIFVDNLRQFKGRDFDIFPLITLCTLDIICETAMGVELNAQTNSDSDYVKAVKEITGIITARHYNFLLRENFFFKLSPLYWRQRKFLKVLFDFTDKVIVARRNELTQSQKIVQSPEDDDFGQKKKMALLDVLLQSSINGQPLSNMDIREEVDTFMFEGHDTTASGIAFCVYNLAKYPDVQQKAFDEVRSVVGDDVDRPVSLQHLNCLNYLELVIKETLRLFPPVPFYGRKIRKEIYLNKTLIPKNSSVGVNAFVMGRDPKTFKDPESFIPERFSAENLNQNPFSYVPFSAGMRNCVGQKFAMLEMKSTISKMLRNFELKLAANFEPSLVAELTLRPSNGIVLELQSRN